MLYRINRVVDSYKNLLHKQEELKQDLETLEENAIQEFGLYDWLKATNQLPFEERGGELNVKFGRDIHSVARALLSLAQNENKIVRIKFNGTDIIAEPNGSINEMLTDWDKRRMCK